jgi:hypothetical protein
MLGELELLAALPISDIACSQGTDAATGSSATI